MIPRYNDAILPVPWYIVISGFHCKALLWPHSGLNVSIDFVPKIFKAWKPLEFQLF